MLAYDLLRAVTRSAIHDDNLARGPEGGQGFFQLGEDSVEALRFVEKTAWLRLHAKLRRRGTRQQRCVVRNLRQRVHCLALAGEGGYASLGELFAHGALRRGHCDEPPIALAERSEVGGKPRQVISRARDR